jgi:hypothetical protein
MQEFTTTCFRGSIKGLLYLFALSSKKVHFALTSGSSQYGLESCNSPPLTSQLRLGTRISGLQGFLRTEVRTKLHTASAVADSFDIWLIPWTVLLVVK